MRKRKLLKLLIGPSPSIELFNRLRGGSDNTRVKGSDIKEAFEYYDDDAFWDDIPEFSTDSYKNFLESAEQAERYTERQKLCTELINKALLDSKNAEDGYSMLNKFRYHLTKRRKFRKALLSKKIATLGVAGTFTNIELRKMCYAKMLGINSLPMSLNGVIGFSLPSFFFFHMCEFYAPPHLKPVCKFGKYTFGLPLILISTIVDKCAEPLEQKFMGGHMPLDLPETGGTIPKDVFDKAEWEKIYKIYRLGDED